MAESRLGMVEHDRALAQEAFGAVLAISPPALGSVEMRRMGEDYVRRLLPLDLSTDDSQELIEMGTLRNRRPPDPLSLFAEKLPDCPSTVSTTRSELVRVQTPGILPLARRVHPPTVEIPIRKHGSSP